MTARIKTQARAEASCDPEDIALKSFFLGPQAENRDWVRQMMIEVLDRWFLWRRHQFPEDGVAISPFDQKLPEFLERRGEFEEKTRQLLGMFEKEVAKFSPRYIGHMVSEIALPALFGHFVALLHNPNNVSGESARVGIVVEDEAIRALLGMVGFPQKDSDGHFTSGGTIANFEALVRARARSALWLARGVANGRRPFEAAHMGWGLYEGLEDKNKSAKELALNFVENPLTSVNEIQEASGAQFKGPVVLVPNHKHYSWEKGVSLLGLGRSAFWTLDLDKNGTISLPHLRQRIEEAHDQGRPILLVVSVVGTTELGHVDPIADIQACLDTYRRERGWHIWHHIDAAYGGFFSCLNKKDRDICNPSFAASLSGMREANSITLDPHKLGYVPYASGTILVKDLRDYRLGAHHVPYIQFAERDRGPLSLEGSRPATGAAATWMVANTVGFHERGYGRILARTIRMRRNLSEALGALGDSVRQTPYGDTNILCFHLAREGEALSISNARTAAFIKLMSDMDSGRFVVSKTELRWRSYQAYLDPFVSSWDGIKDADEVLLVRIVLMNVFFDSKEMSVRILDEFVGSLKAFLND